jgi:hypothetical protein
MLGLSWLAGFLSVLTLRRVWLWFEKIFTKQKLSSTDSIDPTEKRSLTDDQSERVTRFEDLPDELILGICRYLSPPRVLYAFLDCNSRTFRCISDYHTHINLTNWSYTDLQSIRGLIDSKRLVPSVLTLSNSIFSQQTECLSSSNSPLKLSCFEHVHRLSMLDCTPFTILSLHKILANFSRLHSFLVIDCASNNYKLYVDSCRSCLRNLIFDSACLTRR